MNAIFQSTPAWQLRASITPIRGNLRHLMVTSLVPTARRPEERVQWQADLSIDELRALRNAIDQAIEAAS